jgi:DNA polymerase III alpha subunit
LLAARERGYRSLMRLNSRAFLETPVHQSPHIKLEWLEGDAEDLIALTGGPDGPISLALHGDHCALAAAVATGWRAYSAIGSMSNCSATASTRNAASNPA